MSNYILAGVGTIEAFTQSSTQPTKIFTSKTLQESGISISVTAEDIRGGLSNPLLGRYFHDSILEANITDALFNLQYLALNVGGEVVVGGSSLVTETVTAGSGSLTVQGTPVAFGTAGTVGWYTPAGQEDWAPLTFEGKVATASVTSGSEYCVRYNADDSNIQEFVVPSSFIMRKLPDGMFADVLIKEYSFEQTDAPGEENTLSFTWQFADGKQSTQRYSIHTGIFTEQYNQIFA